jgi:membrane protein YqaA with SNARE-associated domain
MKTVATNTYPGKLNRLKAALRRWEFWVGVITVAITFGLAAIIIFSWQFVQDLEGYGYMGGLLISALGGATVIIPVPMLAIQFALGGVLAPWFGPDVAGPAFVGLVCGLGEALGGLTIYITGYTSGTPMANAETEASASRFKKAYLWMTRLMKRRRGAWALFILSAVMNPFYYPAALAAGAVRFGFWRFLFITFAGKVIKVTAITYAGFFGLRGIFSALGIEV